jgi:hypothetical protein
MYFIKSRELEGDQQGLCHGHMNFVVDCFVCIQEVPCSNLVWKNSYPDLVLGILLRSSSPRCWDSIVKYAMTASSHILTV